MTDEERQKLCGSLRQAADDRYSDCASLCAEAANEIEQLVAELEKMGRWYNAAQKQLWAMREKHGHDEAMLSAAPAPPRPDTSAGLIEAAELAEQCANGSFSKNEAMYLRGFADRLRARAADRSGK